MSKQSILDHDLISESFFFPQYKTFENVHYIESEGNQLACHYINKYSDSKTIVHFHGNGETVSNYVSSPLNTLKYNILYVEYRGYGLSEGSQPSLISMLKDVKNVINSLNIEHKNIILFGRSLGSIYAIHAASIFLHIDCLILESAISHVLPRILLRVWPEEVDASEDEFRKESIKYLDNQKKLKTFQGKTLILHTKHDHIVNVNNAQSLFYWANKPKTKHIFEAGDHNNIMNVNLKKYLQLIDDFIQDHK